MRKETDIKTVHDLAEYYLHSPQFLALRGRTQKDYEYVISKVMATPIRLNKSLGDIKVDKVEQRVNEISRFRWVAVGVVSVLVLAIQVPIVMDRLLTPPATASNIEVRQ